MNSRRPRVFIPNKSFHNFEGAREFGDLVFLTEGRIPNTYKLNDVALKCREKLDFAHDGDHLLITGPMTINCIASAILATRLGRVNFLMYDKNADKYTSRTLVLKQRGSDER